ncbi:uncharacterized protein PHALS_07778 [Plasmopara halstedii]|uniref:Uncharacterized protein n=1 Tax=Plasmopara halstedii TaxID=4781 RepID=A0A0P1B5J4_PLAHL|nr:uncharacterized protein PHALS_07778 [Plasmopara halstedii]CEG50049.1 hypothetical protein PHALS_07778 [Plasmopara halstedii]|eukprot:XP_024586418.1 hypothetical protein PHALS_07778 [Plasmopara halstedii]
MSLQQHQQHQQHHLPSSYTDTDMSDSDSESTRPWHHDKIHLKNSAPISIPHHHNKSVHLDSENESLDLSYDAEMHRLCLSYVEDELDEDDPILYRNVAFFQSHNGHSHTRKIQRQIHSLHLNGVTSTLNQTNGPDDEVIFPMDL